MLPYSPFSKDFQEILATDLEVLREVAEGWYVEYKQQLPSSRKEATLGKSLSAFANHYGGWLFYGVASTKDTRTAQSFPGIDLQNVGSYEQSLRDAARHHVNPPPFYRTRILEGPVENIGLSAGRAILVVQIPSGHNAPYIHSSGRIYRRIADSSDPKPETDRTTLDLLYKRGQSDLARLTKFLNQTPILSEGESDLSYVQIFLMRDPLGDQEIYTDIQFKRFAEIMADPSAALGGIPFENAMSSGVGAVARQAVNNDPYRLTLTWKFHNNLSSVILIPLNSAEIRSGMEEVYRSLRDYKYCESLIRALVKSGLSAGKVIDTNYIFMLLMGLIPKYQHLVKESGFPGPIYAKASVHNVWRRVPFLDLEGYEEFLANHSVPIIQYDTEMAPPGTDPDTFVEIEWRDLTTENDQRWRGTEAFQVWIPILSALGLPYRVVCGFDNEKRFGEVWDLPARVMEVQRRRGKKDGENTD